MPSELCPICFEVIDNDKPCPYCGNENKASSLAEEECSDIAKFNKL